MNKSERLTLIMTGRFRVRRRSYNAVDATDSKFPSLI